MSKSREKTLVVKNAPGMICDWPADKLVIRFIGINEETTPAFTSAESRITKVLSVEAESPIAALKIVLLLVIVLLLTIVLLLVIVLPLVIVLLLIRLFPDGE